MASGKSTVGRQLAESLTWPFIDLDEYIESIAQEELGMGIGELFQLGESISEGLNVYVWVQFYRNIVQVNVWFCHWVVVRSTTNN